MRILARKFGKAKTEDGGRASTPMWEKEVAVGTLELPTRAKVLGLKRVWEELGKEQLAI